MLSTLLRRWPHGALLALLFAVSLATRFAFFGYPDSAVIDEVYFAQYLSAYFTGEFYFDTHPPLGRLLVAGFVGLFDFQPVALSTPWNIQYQGHDYLLLRFLPGLVGSLLPLLGYGLAWKLFSRRRLALLCAGLLVLDNALLVQSRFLFFDVFLLAAGFASLLCYLYYRESRRPGWLLASGLLAGAAVSVKWVALTFVVLPILLDYLAFMLGERRLRDVAKTALFMLAGASLVYLLTFAVHLQLLPGAGNSAGYVSAEFQKTLEGSPYAGREDIQPLSWMGRFLELNRVMFEANQRMSDHPYASRWYQWPLNEKPLGYWRQGNLDIVLAGNDLLWWSASLAMAGLALAFLLRPTLWRDRRWPPLLLGYLINWLPFMLIGRVMFIHHYLSALIFSVLALCGLFLCWPRLERHALWLLLPMAAGFLWQAPLSYGLAPW